MKGAKNALLRTANSLDLRHVRLSCGNSCFRSGHSTLFLGFVFDRRIALAIGVCVPNIRSRVMSWIERTQLLALRQPKTLWTAMSTDIRKTATCLYTGRYCNLPLPWPLHEPPRPQEIIWPPVAKKDCGHTERIEEINHPA